MKEKIHFFDAMDANKRNSYLLMGVMFLLVLGVLLAASYIMTDSLICFPFALIGSLVYVFLTYNYGMNIVLSLSNAKPVTRSTHPYLFQIVEGLCIASHIPMQKLYVIPEESPNAFATGKDPEHSAIVVTQGLLNTLDKRELSAVIAHEISHIGNYDIKYMTVTVVMVGLIAIIGRILLRSMIFGGSGGNRKGGGPFLVIALVFVILAPIVATLVRFALSRQKEFLADANSARLTRDPKALIGALKKISEKKMPVKAASDVTAPLYFSDPMIGKFSGIFATHPPVQKRIDRLNQL